MSCSYPQGPIIIFSLLYRMRKWPHSASIIGNWWFLMPLNYKTATHTVRSLTNSSSYQQWKPNKQQQQQKHRKRGSQVPARECQRLEWPNFCSPLCLEQNRIVSNGNFFEVNVSGPLKKFYLSIAIQLMFWNLTPE